MDILDETLEKLKGKQVLLVAYDGRVSNSIVTDGKAVPSYLIGELSSFSDFSITLYKKGYGNEDDDLRTISRKQVIRISEDKPKKSQWKQQQ